MNLEYLIENAKIMDPYIWITSVKEFLTDKNLMTPESEDLIRVLTFHPDAYPTFKIKLINILKNINPL